MSEEFLNAKAWPAQYVQNFVYGSMSPLGHETRFYGPWDTLLNYCFSREFMISPQAAPSAEHCRKSVNFLVQSYVETKERRQRVVGQPNPAGGFNIVVMTMDKGLMLQTVLIVEIKDELRPHPDNRAEADSQICNRYNQMRPFTHLPRLYGISAFGPNIRLYTSTEVNGVSRVDPPYQPVPIFWRMSGTSTFCRLKVLT